MATQYFCLTNRTHLVETPEIADFAQLDSEIYFDNYLNYLLHPRQTIFAGSPTCKWDDGMPFARLRDVVLQNSVLASTRD